MAMTMKDRLKQAEQGRAYWYAKTNKDDSVRVSGVDDCWFRRDATIEELQAALPNPTETYTYFECVQYQKLGRKICRVVVEKIDLTESVTEN